VEYGNNVGVSDIAVGVVTCAQNWNRRVTCSRTWVPRVRAHAGTQLVFVNGEPDLERPYRLDHDTLICRCGDDYDSLTRKTQLLARWMLDDTTCDYLFKCDDDTYVHSSNFAEFEPNGHDYIGCHAGGSYASGGGGYFLSRRAAELVAEAELDDTAEDRAVGNLLGRHGIELRADRRFNGWRDDWGPELELPARELLEGRITTHLQRLAPSKMIELHAHVSP
jgi:hypothetical protein